MIIITAGFVTLLIIVLIISVIYFLRSSVSPKDKILLISLRIMLITAIAIAFFEPELSLNRLSTSKRSIALLIDNSKSMTNFSPDSTVIAPVKRILKSASTNKKISVAAFTFGDTLQSHTRFDNHSFSSTHSDFPDVAKGLLFNFDDFIIISDAQWSSSAARINKLAERQVYYLPLNAISRKSHIDLDCSIADSGTHSKEFAFKTTITGYLSKKNICTLSVSDNNHVFKSSVITIDSGTIDSTVIVPFAARISGKHLFKTTLFNKDSSLRAQDFSLVTIPPKQFTFALNSQVPSLDLRFFTLALKKHPEFKQSSPRLADLSIFVGNQNNLLSAVDTIQSKSVCAFIGVSQCSDSFITMNDYYKIVQNQTVLPPVPFTIPLADLPPLSAFPFCPPELDNASTLLFLSGNNTTAPYPLISLGTFKSHSALRVSFQGLWRWDFWPMSSSRGEEEPFLFSEYLISLCKEMIIARTGSDLLAFPDSDKSENDSLLFAVSLPSELPLSQSVSLELRLRSSSGKPIHMSISKLTTTGSLHYIKTPFPPDSILCYEASLKHNNKQFNYQDCFFNKQANRELLVDNQNTSLLNQYAEPLQLQSDSAISSFFTNLASEQKPLVKQTVPLRRTWWLIALILFLFSIEWYLRKKIE